MPAALVLAAAAAVSACESENALDTNLITVESLSDLLSFSVNGLDNVTGGVQYLWPMTGGQAVVDVTESINSGSAIIQIRDGGNVVRYQEDARDAVDSTTAPGAQGLWQVSIVLTKVTGGFSFTASRLDTMSTP